MDTISIAEALVAELVEQDDVDGTNAVMALRRAQEHVMEYTGGDEQALYTQRTVDEVDDILIMVSQNGKLNYFIH